MATRKPASATKNSSWAIEDPHASTTSGVWGELPVMEPDIDGNPYQNGSNAYLQYGTFINGLWIHDVSADFQLAGKVSQGPLTQDFYPHNLVTPGITFKGQFPNSHEKLRLANFIRFVHTQAIIKSTGANQDNMKFTISNGNQRAHTQKGSPSDFTLYGMIESFDFSIQRFMTAYEYEFTFVPAFVSQNAGGSGTFLSLDFTAAPSVKLMNINQWEQDVVAGKAIAQASQLLQSSLAGVVSSIQSLLGIAAVTTVTSNVNKGIGALPGDLGGIL